MKLKIEGTEIDAAALLAALFSEAKLPDDRATIGELTREAAERIVTQNVHFDFDMIFGRVIRLRVDPRTQEITRTDFYDAVNGEGAFWRAVERAMLLEAEWSGDTFDITGGTKE